MIPTTAAAVRLLTWTWYIAFTVWREARGASIEARTAVACCIMNRCARPGWWGRSPDAVCTKRWQFSSLTDPKDRQLTTWPLADDTSFFECVDVARKVLAGDIENPVPGSDSYFDDSITAPAWTKGARFVGKIDNLNFYDVDHDFEAPAMVAAGESGKASDFDEELRKFLAGT